MIIDSATNLLNIFGGDIQDLSHFLLEERIPDGWQPKVLDKFGITVFDFIGPALKIEFGIEAEVRNVIAGDVGTSNTMRFMYVLVVLFRCRLLINMLAEREKTE